MKKLRKRPIIFFAIVLVCILFILFYAFYFRHSNTYDRLKIDKSQYFVYTISEEEKGYYYQYKPFVNIKGEIGNYINQDIELFFSSFDKDDICITYDSNVSGKVLSLIVKVEDYSYADSAVIYYFQSYNVNLEKNEIVDNDTLFSYFDLTSDVVYSMFNQKLEEYYYELVNDGAISRSCNYECFLNDRGFEDGNDDVEFYVKEGKLIAYKPYINISQGELKIHEFIITE